MSSHHIVRDFQEPALIIADGVICKQELLAQLLEWSPIVLVLDGAMLQVKDWGIKIDYWLGDFDDFDPHKLLPELNQDAIQIIETPDQDKTDLEKGIEFLIEKGVKAIHLCGIDGKRIDHSLSNFSVITKYYPQVQLVVWNNEGKAYFIQSPFTKWFEKDSNVSLIPLYEATQVCSKGLVYELNNHHLLWGKQTSSSNKTSKDGIIEIRFDKGNLLLVELH